jgi:hypothetical protein
VQIDTRAPAQHPVAPKVLRGSDAIEFGGGAVRL